MDGIAGTRMIEREFKQRRCRQARSGAAEPDTRRRQIPQITQGSWRRWRGHWLFGRYRCLAQPYRIVRRVLLTLRRIAGEHDQMMRDQHGADEIFDLAARKPPQRELPEVPFVVAEHADLPEDVAQHGQAELDIRPGRLLRGAHVEALRVGLAV